MYVGRRAMLAGISSAVFVQTKGLGFSLCTSMYSRMAASNSFTLRKTPRRMRLLVISANQRLHDFSKAHHLVPGQAYCVAGKVNSADKLYLVIESVRPDTKHARPSTTPVPAEGAGEDPVA